MKRHLFIAVSHGMHVRNLLNSAVLQDLLRDFRIVILSFEEDIPFLRAAYGASEVDFAPFVRNAAPLENRFEFIRRYLLSNPRRNRTANLFSMKFRYKRPILYPLFVLMNRALGGSRVMRDAWLRFEAAMIPGTEYDALYAKYQPAALVTANYGIGPDDIRLIRAARRAGVPSISIVPSWDNLSSKGVMGVKPDKLIVWNEIMRGEAVDLHDYRSGDVAVLGAVQFDAYADRSAYGTREEHCRNLGLDPERKIIVYGTITPVYFPGNIQIIEMLAQASRRDELAGSPQILVRLHPQVVRDAVFGDRIDDYRRLLDRYPNTVFLDVPQVKQWNVMSPPHPRDAKHLGSILFHADVCVVPGSTLALDAIANDTPVVGIAFDGDKQLPYAQSIRRWYDFTYYKPLIDLGGLELARSRDEMIALLGDMLADKARGAEIRNAVVERYLGRLDGQAGHRAASLVFELTGHGIDRNRPPGEAAPEPAPIIEGLSVAGYER